MTGDLRVPSRNAEHPPREHTMSDMNPWPGPFRLLHERLSASGPEIVVAESFEQTVDGVRTLRMMTCGLVKPGDLSKLTDYGRMGYQVCTSGPYPTPREDAKSGQEPWFRIAAGGVEAEPLIHSWEHSNHTAFVPDTKFVMTYGLMPRAIPKKNQLHWDDPGAPRPDVVKGDLSTVFKWPNLPPAAVLISREYLLDYLALRKRALVAFFYERHWLTADAELDALLAGTATHQKVVPDGLLLVRRHAPSELPLSAELNGARVLIDRGTFTVSMKHERMEDLRWPGYAEPVVGDAWRGFSSSDFVYVSDKVLAIYEGRPEFAISPLMGAVDFGGTWCVDYCTRIGRDLIRLELKKLYEGVPPEVTRHWHGFAVEPPRGNADELLNVRNIAVRAQDVVNGYLEVGKWGAELVSALLGRTVSANDLIKLDPADVEYRGWWKFEAAERISRHAELAMTREEFLQRCKDLARLVMEPLDASLLKQAVDRLGIPGKDVGGSLRLLNLLLKLCRVATSRGQVLFAPSATAPIGIADVEGMQEELPQIFAVNALRQLDAHRKTKAEEDEALERALEMFGVDAAETAAGFGSALDAVYDRLAAELKAAGNTLFRQVHE